MKHQYKQDCSVARQHVRTSALTSTIERAHAAPCLLRFPFHLAIVLHSFSLWFPSFRHRSGMCVVVWCVLFSGCGCKYRQCFTGLFILFPFPWRKGHLLLIFVCFLISYCLALSFSESTSSRSVARSLYSIQHYWELTTLPISLVLFVVIGGIFLVCFCRRHAKRAKHQILSEWGILSVRGGLFSIRFLFVFVS